MSDEREQELRKYAEAHNLDPDGDRLAEYFRSTPPEQWSEEDLEYYLESYLEN